MDHVNKERKQKAALTTLSSLLYEAAAIVCGFILPRLFITTFGSEVNGLITSVSRFLSYISLADLGVGAVVRSNYYSPLAVRDKVLLSKIYRSSEIFFRRIACILLVYVVVLMIIYPRAVNTSFSGGFIICIILILAVDSFAEYYFGMPDLLLLSADQREYYVFFIRTATLIINTVVCMVLIKCGCSIITVKLSTSIIFLSRPLAYRLLARKRYDLDRKVQITEEPIKQKWNGFAQHVAAVLLENTDVFLLSIFSSLSNVSIYNVYFLVISGVKSLVTAFAKGVQALFGNMFANNEKEALKSSFSSYEWRFHTIATFVFSLTFLLILPFVKVYTRGITDVSYYAPAFAYILTSAYYMYCLRLPYNIIVLAACRYKETQRSAILEVLINLTVSTPAVILFGLPGAALGTLAAMLYRTIYLANYISKDLIDCSLTSFLKHLAIDAITIAVILTSTMFISVRTEGYFPLIIDAFKLLIIAAVDTLLINLLFYKKEVTKLIRITKRPV